MASTPTTLPEVLIAARQQAAQMHHAYLGVEHLFIAVVSEDAAVSETLQLQDIDPGTVIAYTFAYASPGDDKVLWGGHPYTPRATVILSLAHDLAIEAGRAEAVTGVDVWQAIIEEGDSLPVHILTRLGFAASM
jgi:ATP-dependent Clp protease ATP-binding subunit ClpA